MNYRLICSFLCLMAGAAAADAAAPYCRYPALRGEALVFTAEGDLWRVPVAGGEARRLTTHAGTESHACFSPDGKSLAFSAQYEGPLEVYTMPLEGGLPVRLTWDGEGATATGWTPDGRVVYSTKAFSTLPNDQLATVDPVTGEGGVVPLAQASEGAWEETGRMLFFTRLPFQGSSTKRYQGGTAQNLWRWEAGTPEAVPLTTDFPGTSKNPMPWQGRVYFISDRDGMMNLWSMKGDGSDLQQLTRHRTFDVKNAALDAGRIVYQYGAGLRIYRVAEKSDTEVPVTLASDHDQMREKWVKKPFDYLTSAHLSPEGDRVVLTARGEVFVVPVEHGGRMVELPRKEGVRYRYAKCLADGKTILTLSDETGELEFWTLPANGLGVPKQVTKDGAIFRFAPVPSRDGKWISWQDKNRVLWVLNLEKGEPVVVATSQTGDFDDMAWSQDSQWLAYVEEGLNTCRQIKLFRPADGARVTATSDRLNSFSPAWSPDGKWLYFLSERNLRSLVESPWGPRQPEPFFTEVTGIYALALQPGLRPPFLPGDELHPAPRDAKAPVKDGEKKDEVVRVDLKAEGLETRLHQLPVAAGNYADLVATGRHLLWSAKETGFDGKTALRQLELKPDTKPKTLVEDAKAWELSGNGRKVLVRLEKPDRFFVFPADVVEPPKLEKPVKLDEWTFAIDPREEWRQIFAESWRMLRDYFYDPKLHGVDWAGVRKKYEPLVERVADRGDLSDLLHEMAGELAALHTFVRYGDDREGPDQVKAGSLGARLVRDAAAGGWRVEHIYRTDPDYPELLSPLARAGVDVHDGEVLVSINGTPLLTVPHPARLLRNQAGRPVMLEVKPAAGGEARQVLVKPLNLEQAQSLRYDEWEYTRRLEVEKTGAGQIGYVHLRAMGTANIAEWARDFYPVFNRAGLIIDVRHNRGGNIDSWILEKLMRKAWFYWSRRTGAPTWNMQYAFRGHVAVLCDERTASDGEAFSEGIKRLGLGQVIGTRTWGGEIWLSAQRWLVDGGMATAAESGVFGPEGAWLIEGHGVEPDQVVDNLPRAAYEGRDTQLEAALQHLQKKIAEDPRPVPPIPAKPDKAAK